MNKILIVFIVLLTFTLTSAQLCKPDGQISDLWTGTPYIIQEPLSLSFKIQLIAQWLTLSTAILFPHQVHTLAKVISNIVLVSKISLL
jgi:hypothetical protein